MHPDDLELLAELVADGLAERLERLERPPAAGRLLTAAEVAVRLGVRRDLVYARAGELGAVRIGDGPRPRLRFDPAAVDAALSREGSRGSQQPEEPAATEGRRRRRRRSTPTSVQLLRIRGRER